eukprot:354775-Chlamydomonas_euryale.AAC.1
MAEARPRAPPHTPRYKAQQSRRENESAVWTPSLPADMHELAQSRHVLVILERGRRVRNMTYVPGARQTCLHAHGTAARQRQPRVQLFSDRRLRAAVALLRGQLEHQAQRRDARAHLREGSIVTQVGRERRSGGGSGCRRARATAAHEAATGAANERWVLQAKHSAGAPVRCDAKYKRRAHQGAHRGVHAGVQHLVAMRAT